MTPSAYIRVRNAAGIVQTVLTGGGSQGGANGYLALRCVKKRNGVDVADFKVNINHPDIQYLTIDKYIIEIVRSNSPYLNDYVLFSGFLRDLDIFEDRGQVYLTVIAFGANHILSWPIIAYDAKVNNRTVFTNVKAETAFKTLVLYNAGAQALTANQRDTSNVISGLNVETDLGRGNTISFACTRPYLLEVLQSEVRKAGGDFSTVFLTPTTYEFRFHPGQLGIDRSATLVFSLDRGNMSNPRLTLRRSTERTVAIVGGEGAGAARQIRVRTGANYSSTNKAEVFVDARRADSTTVLDSLGDTTLANMRANYVLTYDVLQTDQDMIDRDYGLGDKVRAVFAGFAVTQIIDELYFTWDNKGESIKVKTVNI